MSKIVLVVEYNGRQYAGFQFQSNLPTVQDEIEKAIFKVSSEKLRVFAASRTDAGVHAKGQVVSFRTQSSLNPRTWARALNFYLPEDVAVKAVYKAPDNFNIRKEAISREYRYYILNRASPSPLKRAFAYHVPSPLNITGLQEASQELVGEKDFSSFTCPYQGSKVRTIYKADIDKKEEIVSFRVEANSFLPHQIRNTVGALLKVGLGKMDVDEFRGVIKAQRPSLAGPTAPPYGLYLMKVNYPKPLKESGESYEGY